MKEKNYRSAIRAYEDALKENPNLPAQTRLNLGHAYYETGQNRLAQKNYLAALNGLSSPVQKSNACLQLGNLFVKEKNYKTSLDWFQKSLLQSPENKIARRNFELAWHQNKKKEEEEQKKNPERNRNQDKDKSQSNQNKQENGQNNQNQTSQGKNSNSQQNPDKPGNQKGEQEEQKEEANKPDSKKTESKKTEEEKQGESKEEEKDENGKESRKKTDESNSEDPDAFRLDRQKLKESGLNEEQAKNMLQAMRQNEVKYLQQRRFKGKSNAKGNSGPRW